MQTSMAKVYSVNSMSSNKKDIRELIDTSESNNIGDLTMICSRYHEPVSNTVYLRNEFDFWSVHGIMNASGLLQNK